jgi:TubC N-terminal docking domain
MSAVVEILAELCRRGVVVRADGERIGLKPKAALDDNLLARIKANKGDILAALSLSGRPTACASSCYEIESGKWIHHPWDGCRTLPPSLERVV